VSQVNLLDQHERWQLRGTAPAAYERYLVPTLFTPWAVDLLARVALQPYMDEAGLAVPYAIHVAVASAYICAVVSGCVMLRSQEARTSASPDRTEGHSVALPLPG
jgi:hypothetical protein